MKKDGVSLGGEAPPGKFLHFWHGNLYIFTKLRNICFLKWFSRCFLYCTTVIVWNLMNALVHWYIFVVCFHLYRRSPLLTKFHFPIISKRTLFRVISCEFVFLTNSAHCRLKPIVVTRVSFFPPISIQIVNFSLLWVKFPEKALIWVLHIYSGSAGLSTLPRIFQWERFSPIVQILARYPKIRC